MPDTTEVQLAAWERNPLFPNGARELSPALQEIARQRPDELAVDDGVHRVTFSELRSRANRMANAIIDHNPDPANPVVALCTHGIDPITMVLGVVSAGHLVSPLDGRDPADRLAQIVVRSGAAVIVAERELVDVAREIAPQCAILVLDDALAYPDTAPIVTITDTTPGLIVFTSGSTGTPKGVVQGHRALVAKGLVRAFGGEVHAGDHVVLNSSFSFSATFSRVFTTVMSGASLFTYDPRVRGQRGYAEWVNENEITSLSFMTPLLRALLDVPNTPVMPAVRAVQVGGDTVYGIDITRARRLFRPDIEFTAGFSSTETGGVCSYVIPPEDEHDSRPIPIGTVEPWTQITVVDPETDEPVAEGEPGRMVVHNHLLSLGYWKDPETTDRHFFTDDDGRRWFRTNDMVRVRESGVVEHHGRIDFRVKVHGALVGLSEVEGAILSTDGIAHCVVVGDELPEGGHRLIAYVVPEAGVTLTLRELRREIVDPSPHDDDAQRDRHPRRAPDGHHREGQPPGAADATAA